MDYGDLLAHIEKASLFDIYRLQAAISMMLDDPKRLARVREQLVPGQETTYFDWQENRPVKVRILELKRKRVLVWDLEDQRRYTIPMYWINVEDADLNSVRRTGGRGIPRSELRVGDQVGFRDRRNVTQCAEVIRLNPKTATLRVQDGAEWRVGYGLLFDIIEGQRAHRKLVSHIEILDVDSTTEHPRATVEGQTEQVQVNRTTLDSPD